MLPIPPPTLDWIYAATVFLAILIVIVAAFVWYGVDSIKRDVESFRIESLGDNIETRSKIRQERSTIVDAIKSLETNVVNRLITINSANESISNDVAWLYAKDVERAKQLEYLVTAFNVLSDQIEKLDTALINQPVEFSELQEGEQFTSERDSEPLYGYQKKNFLGGGNAFSVNSGERFTFKDDVVVYRRNLKLVEV